MYSTNPLIVIIIFVTSDFPFHLPGMGSKAECALDLFVDFVIIYHRLFACLFNFLTYFINLFFPYFFIFLLISYFFENRPILFSVWSCKRQPNLVF